MDAWWCDSSEPVTPEWSREMKPEAGEMYHTFVTTAADCMPPEKSAAYSLYHAKGIYEGQRACTEEKRVVNLTRSGWPGSQKYGAFLPVFRSHGTDCPREPWQFGAVGDPYYEALCAAIRLRYRLLPYLYSTAGAVWREDGLMMRPLFFDFPTDAQAADIEACVREDCPGSGL